MVFVEPVKVYVLDIITRKLFAKIYFGQKGQTHQSLDLVVPYFDRPVRREMSGQHADTPLPSRMIAMPAA